MDELIIGKYRVLRKLGEGGMGVVYAAEHVELGGQAAIKVLLAEWIKEQEIVKRFFNEARAAARIRHRGIVEIYDFGHREDGSAYIIMEYLDGEDLFRRMRKRGRIPPAHAIHFALQICSALEAAHKHNVIHRDLKPGNVFLVPDPQVPGGERIKLLDFGIAKVQIEGDPSAVMTRAGSLMGTPTYMAPEQCTGATNVDQRSDVYSVGCMLFEMLCGRPPFVGQPTDVMVAKMRDEPPPPSSLQPEVWPELDAVVQKALARKPEDRYQSAAQLEEALGELLASPLAPVSLSMRSGPISFTQPGAGTLTGAAAGSVAQQTSPVRRRWIMPLALASTLLIGGAATAMVLFHEGEPPVLRNQVAPAPTPAPPPPLEFRQLDSYEQEIERSIDKSLWVIDSTPSGADVIHRDEVRGKTPIAILVERDPDRKEAVILRLDPDNYGDGFVQLEASRDTQIVIELDPIIDVEIVSRPPGASVYMPDGTFLGKTPMSARLPRTDEPQILVLEQSGYMKKQIAVDFSEPGEVTAVLERAVTVLIDSEPAGAELWLGEELLGQTPYKDQLPRQPRSRVFTLKLGGCHDQKVRMSGHSDDSAIVTLRCD